jgi:xyloglucan:xyloglucosyl transferase
MVVDGCIFEASQWATEGGAVPIDYQYAPFNVEYRNINITACQAAGNDVGACATNYANNWWEQAPYDTFGTDWNTQMQWVRQHYLHYSYCYDTVRYPVKPVECQYNGEN